MKNNEFQWPDDLRKTRADQILDSFEVFHFHNPNVWALFKQFALQAIASGRERYSSDCVCHRIRWHTAIETRGEEVKINDHYTAYYARLFHLAYPEHSGFFKNRKLISENVNAFESDIKVFNAGECSQEESILKRLSFILGRTT